MWRQGRFIQAGAFTWLPVFGLTPDRPSKMYPQGTLFGYSIHKPKGMFQKRGWDFMLVFPYEERF